MNKEMKNSICYIKFTTEDQCIPTITKLNKKNATTGFEVIFKTKMKGFIAIIFFISLCIPSNRRGGETKAKTRCSTEWTENRYFSPISCNG